MKRQASGGIWTQFLQTCGPILYSLNESISFKALVRKCFTIVNIILFLDPKNILSSKSTPDGGDQLAISLSEIKN